MGRGRGPIRGWGGGGGGQGGGRRVGCEWKSEAFVKIQKKNIFFLGGGGGLGSVGGVWLGGGGVRVDGNREVKLV